MPVTIREVDHGYERAVRSIYAMGKPVIAVGILDRGQDAHRARGGAVTLEENDEGQANLTQGQTVLEVAIDNEFGKRSADGKVIVPARSFIRAWFDESQAEIRGFLSAVMPAVIQGKRTKEQALELVAQKCVASIQRRMARGIDPPNAERTILAKGSTVPLIDTGQLRSSVTYRVTP